MNPYSNIISLNQIPPQIRNVLVDTYGVDSPEGTLQIIKQLTEGELRNVFSQPDNQSIGIEIPFQLLLELLRIAASDEKKVMVDDIEKSLFNDQTTLIDKLYEIKTGANVCTNYGNCNIKISSRLNLNYLHLTFLKVPGVINAYPNKYEVCIRSGSMFSDQEMIINLSNMLDKALNQSLKG